MNICTIDTCDNKHEALGYCVKHYKRYRKYGEPYRQSTKDRRLCVSMGENALLPLGINAKDGYATISAQDKWVDSYNWYLGKNGYPATRLYGKLITLHRLLLAPPSGLGVDHIDRNKLNNTRENLRLCTQQQNSWNSSIKSTNTSGSKGVSYNKRLKKYESYIVYGGKRKLLGNFNSVEEAANAYSKAAKALFGEYANSR